MSRTLNKVQLIGRLGADPQMRYTTAGAPVVTFSLATNRQWQDKEGGLREETDWHNIVAWEKLAQICSEHLTKGRLVYIEGRLQTRSYESEGQTRYKTEIVASDMLILDSRAAGASSGEVIPRPEEEPVTSAAGGSRQRDNRPTPVYAGAAPTGRSARSSAAQPIEDPEDLPF